MIEPPHATNERSRRTFQAMLLGIGCLVVCTQAVASNAYVGNWRLNVFAACFLIFLSLPAAVARFAYLVWKGRPWTTNWIDRCVWVATHLTLLPWYVMLFIFLT